MHHHFYGYSICSFLGVALGGCSSMPPFDAPENKSGAPSVHHVIQKIECEIAQAKFDPENNKPNFIYHLEHDLNLAPFSEWVANVTLSLTVNDTGGLSPTGGLSLAYLEPLKVTGTSFSFGGNALLYQQRQRIFTQTYTVSIKSLTLKPCERFETATIPAINLEGDLGLRDQIRMGLHAFHRDDSSDYSVGGSDSKGSPDSFGATVSFDVFKGITNLGPNWTLVRFKGPNGGVGYQRDDLHKIAITFAPVAFGKPVAGMRPELTAQYALHSNLASASELARVNNIYLVQTQAIQQLSQTLSSH